ncbi:maternal protein exuperantia isoform X2 [Thrips palmi]|nr:maternal protein exuperantia isoform X2 [Thrips palmi]XP_034246977.1 maternal protein exuperantia isoform X2 [Thrips palmi]XP_034246978.1 maternal protein exuperantia isoform X2 [Thrips palmi]
MVTSTDKPVSGDGDSAPIIPKADGLPIGNYRIVGWDLDISGRRLVDEILQIAAYTPDKEFSLYVMPSRDLNIAARRRHKLKVVTINRYRVLKHLKNSKAIKTKSEISGLRDFVEWLEAVKGDAKDGIILVFHEQLQVCPALLLHCLGRYPHAELLQRFKNVVAGFANGFAVAQSKCANSTTNCHLRTLSAVLLGKEEGQESAADRARLIYQVLQKLCTDDGADNSGAGDSAAPTLASMISCVREYTQPCRREEELLIEQQEMIKRQDALRPVFLQLIRGNRKDKLRAYSLRKQLLDANIDMALITEAWNSGQRDAVATLLKEKAQLANEDDLEELTKKIEWHFVPELRPKREPRQSFSKRSRKSSKSIDKTDGTSDINSSADNNSSEATTPTESPDVTVICPEKPSTPEKVPASPEKSPKSPKSKSPKLPASSEKTTSSPEKVPASPEASTTVEKSPTTPEKTTPEKPSSSPEKSQASPKSKSSNKSRKSPEKSRNKAKESQGAVAC